VQFTQKQIIEILARAQELGVKSLRVDGLEVSFAGPLPTLPLIEVQRPELVPGSSVDHEWRRKGIGGSDAPIVMQKADPERAVPLDWCTRQKLFELKLGLREPEPPNYQMRRGLRLEPIARARYQDETGIAMPAKALIHPKHPFIRANADGVNLREGRALEIKCPGRKDHAMALAGKIPPKYHYQLVHILFVFDLDRIDYYSFDGENGVIVPFDRKKALEKKLFSEERKFWEQHIEKAVPPEPPTPLRERFRVINGKIDPFRVRKNPGDR
jgi:putative phage-type endonuclease